MEFLRKIFDKINKQAEIGKGFNLKSYKEAQNDPNTPILPVQQPQTPVQQPKTPVQQPQQGFDIIPKEEKTVEQRVLDEDDFYHEMSDFIKNNLQKEVLDVQPDKRWFYNQDQKDFFMELVVEASNNMKLGDEVLNNFLRQVKVLGMKQEVKEETTETIPSIGEEDPSKLYSNSALGKSAIERASRSFKGDASLVNEAVLYRLSDPLISQALRGKGGDGRGRKAEDQRINFLSKNPEFLSEELMSKKPEEMDVKTYLRQDGIKDSAIQELSSLLKEENNSLFSKLSQQIYYDAGNILKSKGQQAKNRKEESIDVGDEEGKTRAGQISEKAGEESKEQRKGGKLSQEELEVMREKITSAIQEDSQTLMPQLHQLTESVIGSFYSSDKIKDKNLAEQMDIYNKLLKENYKSVMDPNSFTGFTKKQDGAIYRSHMIPKSKGMRGSAITIPFDAFLLDSSSGGGNDASIDSPSDRVRNWEPRLDKVVANSQLALVNGEIASIKKTIKDYAHKKTNNRYINYTDNGYDEYKIADNPEAGLVGVRESLITDIYNQKASEIKELFKYFGDEPTEENIKNFINLTLDQSYDYVFDKMGAVDEVGYSIADGKRVSKQWTNSKGKEKNFRLPKNFKDPFRISSKLLLNSLEHSQGMDPRVLRTFAKFMNYNNKVLTGKDGALIPKGREIPVSFINYQKMHKPIPKEAIDSAIKKNPKVKDKLLQVAKNYNNQFEALANNKNNFIFVKYCQVVDELDKLYKYKKCYSNLKIASNRIDNVDILIDKAIHDFKLFLERIE